VSFLAQSGESLEILPLFSVPLSRPPPGRDPFFGKQGLSSPDPRSSPPPDFLRSSSPIS